MKKINYLVLGAAGLLLASCANEDLKSPGNGGLEITINLPSDLATRADEAQMKLYYAVYSGDDVVETDNITFSGTQTKLGLNLLSGKEYTVAFFAQNAACEGVYDFDADAQTVSVSYTDMNSSEANNTGVYDCFYGSIADVSGDETGLSVTLYRPLAQINWGATDLNAATVQNIYGENGANVYATLSTTAANSFNILTGAISGEEKIDLGPFQVPTATYPTGTGIDYVAMQYVLAPKTSAVYDLNLAISNSEDGTDETTEVVVTAAPLQANYRTNIYGSLFTDNFNINIQLADWTGDFENPLGEPYLEGLYREGNTYTITNEIGLQNYITKVLPRNYKGNTLDKYVMSDTIVVLGNDLDMSKYPGAYTPFNNSSATFDGNGHTISNLTVDVKGQMEGGNPASAGFMSSAIGTVQNVNFKNANIAGNYKVGVVAGDGDSAYFSKITVDGAILTSTPWLKGSLYDDGNNCGGIVGYLAAEPNASITGCTVSNAAITAYRKVGGIVGYVAGGGVAVVENNTVENCTITANQQITNGTYDGQKDFEAGEITGGYVNNASVKNNTPIDVTLNTISSTGETTNYIPTAEAWLNLIKDKSTWNNTVNLTGDLDFGGAEVTGTRFMGTLNGNGHTIKNGIIIPKSSYATGFFAGDVGSGTLTVNNVTFENMTATNSGTTDNSGWAAVVIADVQTFNVTLNNVKVIDSKIKGLYCLGGLVGFVASGKTLTVNGCTVEGCTLENIGVANVSGFVSGMVGRVVGTATFGSGNTVEDVVINAYYSLKRGEETIAAVAAPNSATTVINGLSDVKVDNVKINKTLYN